MSDQPKNNYINRCLVAPNGEEFCWYKDSGIEGTVHNIYCHNCNNMQTVEIIGVGSKYYDETDRWYPEWKIYYAKGGISDRQKANWKEQDDIFGSRRAAAMNAIDHVIKIVRELNPMPLFCYHFVQWVDKNYPELITPKVSGSDYRILDERWENAEQGILEI